jgi:hypothetical protein
MSSCTKLHTASSQLPARRPNYVNSSSISLEMQDSAAVNADTGDKSLSEQ